MMFIDKKFTLFFAKIRCPFSSSFLFVSKWKQSSWISQFCRFDLVVKSRFVNKENVSSCMWVQTMRQKRNRRSRRRKGKRERNAPLISSPSGILNGLGMRCCKIWSILWIIINYVHLHLANEEFMYVHHPGCLVSLDFNAFTTVNLSHCAERSLYHFVMTC